MDKRAGPMGLSHFDGPIVMSSPVQLESGSSPAQPCSIWKLFTVASISIGLYFISAIQMFWLAPIYYILGVPDRWISFEALFSNPPLPTIESDAGATVFLSLPVPSPSP
ncbi:uncharacterized protein DS421_17g594150 [Arachis hypogaea]|nr:uncharacterized protein DS421_17g594150 [Arachis hypogaea]